MDQFELVLGTRNQKKRRELEYLLRPYDNISLRTLDEFPQSVEVEETGTTFRENAHLKAIQQATAIGKWVLAEDSGLSVTALDGAPGVYSARFSGEHATDETNNDLLLERLGETPIPSRTAWYTCYMALANPQGEIVAECEGRCYGRILNQRLGVEGFGYDPLFEIPEYKMTFGQLGDAVKAVLSHRARANRKFVPQLLKIARRELTVR